MQYPLLLICFCHWMHASASGFFFLQDLKTRQMCHCQFFHKSKLCCFPKMSSLPDLTIPRYDHACTEWITDYKFYITWQPIFIIDINQGLISIVILKVAHLKHLSPPKCLSSMSLKPWWMWHSCTLCHLLCCYRHQVFISPVFELHTRPHQLLFCSAFTLIVTISQTLHSFDILLDMTSVYLISCKFWCRPQQHFFSKTEWRIVCVK